MKKIILIIACCSLTPLTLLAQEKNAGQKGSSTVVAPLANVSTSATVEAPATGNATLTSEADVNAIPVVSRLKPERVTGPTRHATTINNGKPVPPKTDKAKGLQGPSKK